MKKKIELRGFISFPLIKPLKFLMQLCQQSVCIESTTMKRYWLSMRIRARGVFGNADFNRLVSIVIAVQKQLAQPQQSKPCSVSFQSLKAKMHGLEKSCLISYTHKRSRSLKISFPICLILKTKTGSLNPISMYWKILEGVSMSSEVTGLSSAGLARYQ